MNIKSAFLSLFLLAGICGCHNEKKKQIDLNDFYKPLIKNRYETFRNWDVYLREGENVYVCDYHKTDPLTRFVAMFQNNLLLVKESSPMDSGKFIPIDLFPEEALSKLEIKREELKRNLIICNQNKLEKVKYDTTINGLFIVKEEHTLVYSLDAEGNAHVKKKFKRIDSKWYYLPE